MRPLPLAPFRSVLKLERRISREGMVSVGGNAYSVPDATRSRLVEVHSLADEVRIFENGELIAVHPVLEGRKQRRVAPDHRRSVTSHRARPQTGDGGVTATAPVTKSSSALSLSMMLLRRPWLGRPADERRP